jgi:ketosteroid isomerase-like protein
VDSAAQLEAIQTAEDRRWEAIVGADAAGLAALLTDDFVYRHSSGVSEAKDAILDNVRSGQFTHMTTNRTTERIWMMGDVGFMVEQIAFTSSLGPINGRPEYRGIALTVWSLGDDGWQLVAGQETEGPYPVSD